MGSATCLRPAVAGLGGATHRTRRDRGNGGFGESDIEGKAAMGSGERGGKRTNGAVGTRAT